MGPKSNDMCHSKRQKGRKHRDESHMKMEAEIGGMIPDGRERWEPQETGKGVDRFPPESQQRAHPHRYVDWASSLQRCKRINLVVVSHHVGGNLLWQP